MRDAALQPQPPNLPWGRRRSAAPTEPTGTKRPSRLRPAGSVAEECRGARGALLVLILLLLLPSTDALANRKTDVITLYNGDRLTGELKALSDGRLSLSTDAMGTVNIEWREVAAIESRYNYELRLSDGRRFFGTVQPGLVPGTTKLTDVYGEQSFGWQEIVEIRAISGTVEERLDLYLSANYAFTKASGVRQTELIANVDFSERDAINSLSSRLTVSDTDDNSTTSSRVTAQRQTWTDRERNFRLLFGGFESNDELGLDARYNIGAGIGRYMIDTNNRTLTAAIGLQGITENGADGSQQESLEGVLGANFKLWRFTSPEMDLSIGGTVYPSLTESGRVRADSTARVRWEIIDDLYWNVNAWGSYDSESVDVEGGEFDWGITTGIGWSF